LHRIALEAARNAGEEVFAVPGLLLACLPQEVMHVTCLPYEIKQKLLKVFLPLAAPLSRHDVMNNLLWILPNGINIHFPNNLFCRLPPLDIIIIIPLEKCQFPNDP